MLFKICGESIEKYCKYNSQTQDPIIFGRAPNLLARMGREFPTMRRSPRTNPTAQWEVLRPTQ